MEWRRETIWCYKVRLWAAFGLLAGFFVFSAPAHACDPCGCVPLHHGSQYTIPDGYRDGSYGNNSTIRGFVRRQHEITTDHILEEFDDWEYFLVDVDDPLNDETIFGRYLLPAMMMMTEQLVHTAMTQMFALGTMLDAKTQLETQTLFQKLEAEAHRNYHPSHDMCVIGTNVRSLAAAGRNAEFATFVLSQRSIDRQMGNAHSAAARGQFDDYCFRLRQFRGRYCDMRDNNEQMQWVCDPEAATEAAGVDRDGDGKPDPFNPFRPECLPDDYERVVTNETKNKDISFTRTIDRAKTLEIDFAAKADEPSTDEEDIFALASNLYSHDVMFRMPESALFQRQSQDELLDMRHIVAKRAVAEHSFNTIVGMKAMGTPKSNEDTYPYMRLILESLDLGDDGAYPEHEIAMYLNPTPRTADGEPVPELARPSYDAQMEILTKKIFQSPDFFVNLYDEPVNVERKGVALQAIGLMQDFDTWNSYLRTEAILSVILELELLKLHGHVQNQMGDMRSGGLEL